MANEMIEIPFGAYDSELMGWTYTIPEDMTAEIKDGKIVVKKKESEYNALEFLKGQAIEMIANIEHDISQSVYDGIKGHSPEDERELERWKKALAWLEKQKESKVVEFDHFREQKPAQTVEEKEYIRTIMGIIADFVRDKQPEDVAFYQKIYDWLDGRHIEQKPAEWSEEDEENFKWFDKLFRAESIVLGGRDIPQDKYLWFKSLRPDSYKNCNSRWKPLPESMEALLLAIEGKWDAIKPTGYMSRRLEDLYDGLVNTFDVDENYQRNSYGKEIH